MSVWTDDELKYLKQNYEDLSKHELATRLNKTSNAVQLKANRLGLKKKSKYYYKKDFFKNILTPNQAYWLGFIYADGYVTKQKESVDTYSTGIELSISDIEHLRNFNIDIDGNIDVTIRHRKSKYKNKIIEGDICSIRLYCSELSKDLIEHGCTLRKSLTKDKPTGVPEYLMRDFIRGYFDGNGTICFAKLHDVKRYLRVQIETGSDSFAKWISLYMNNKGFETYICKDGKKSFKVHVKSEFCLDFLNYIYKDSERYLKRKYEKYMIAVCGDNTLTTNHYGAKSVEA